jgi:hypothetical protein
MAKKQQFKWLCSKRIRNQEYFKRNLFDRGRFPRHKLKTKTKLKTKNDQFGICRLQIGLYFEMLEMPKKCRKRKKNMDLLVYIVRQNSRVVKKTYKINKKTKI